MLGTPIDGTPLASAGTILTLGINLPNPLASYFADQGVIASLSTISPEGAAAKKAFLASASKLPIGNIELVGGTMPYGWETFLPAKLLFGFIFGFGAQDDYDGLVPRASALSPTITGAHNVTLGGYTIETASPNETHTELECGTVTGGDQSTFIGANAFKPSLAIPDLSFVLDGVDFTQSVRITKSQLTVTSSETSARGSSTEVDRLPIAQMGLAVPFNLPTASGSCGPTQDIECGVYVSGANADSVKVIVTYGPPCTTNCVTTTTASSTGFVDLSIQQSTLYTLSLNELVRPLDAARIVLPQLTKPMSPPFLKRWAHMHAGLLHH